MPREAEIISRVSRLARRSPNVAVGIGDDAAVIQLDPCSDLIACCDVSVEGVHFRREWASAALIGRKALAVTLSDVAAMGGSALYSLLSVAFPPSTSSDYIAELLKGIFDLADQQVVSIVGGDTSVSSGPLFIDTTVIGECTRGRAIKRSGARPGDRIYVTGSLGASAMGLNLLKAGFKFNGSEQAVNQQAAGEDIQKAIMKHLVPEPRLKVGESLGKSGLASAMIDISDGLTTDLSHILEASGCGALLNAKAIPVVECLLRFSKQHEGYDCMSMALHGGEEFELLFTAGPDEDRRLSELSAALGMPITAIGEVISRREMLLELEGKTAPLEAGGFEHQI